MTTPTTRTLGRDDWMTPAAVFKPLHRHFMFTGDACATDEKAARVPTFISPELDALHTDWRVLGDRVWCNPPYGRAIADWFARVEDQVAHGSTRAAVMLTFANTDTRYWERHVASSRFCHQVVFLRPRVRFDLPQGGQRAGAPKGSALLVYRDEERGERWPRHCYADWTAPHWVERSGLADLAHEIRGDR